MPIEVTVVMDHVAAKVGIRYILTLWLALSCNCVRELKERKFTFSCFYLQIKTSSES